MDTSGWTMNTAGMTAIVATMEAVAAVVAQLLANDRAHSRVRLKLIGRPASTSSSISSRYTSSSECWDSPIESTSAPAATSARVTSGAATSRIGHREHVRARAVLVPALDRRGAAPNTRSGSASGVDRPDRQRAREQLLAQLRRAADASAAWCSGSRRGRTAARPPQGGAWSGRSSRHVAQSTIRSWTSRRRDRIEA